MNSKPLTILHYLGNQGMTGVEIFVLSLAKAQKEMGQLARLTCHPKGRDVLFKLAQKEAISVDPFHVPARSRSKSFMGKILGQLLAVKRIIHLVRLIRQHSIEVLHIHPVGVHALPAFIAGWLAQVPKIIVTHHAKLNWPHLSFRQRLILGLEKKLAHRVVVTYAGAAEELMAANLNPTRVRIIPLCLDSQLFQLAKSQAPCPEICLFLMSARLIDGKGHSLLLEAFQRLYRRFPKVRLTLVGGGPLLPELIQAIKLGQLEDIVSLTGYVSHEAMRNLYAAADAVVLPSFMPGETFPISLLEAGAMGLPVIGTRWSGIPDIIVDGETGLLVDPQDLESLYQAMEKIVTRPDLARAMGLAAEARATALYDSFVIARKYTELFDEDSFNPRPCHPQA
jgi:glycosyltransferase involved in cell wall biosynthesis